MNRRIGKVGLVALSVTVLVGTALAFSTIFSFQGTVAGYDFGGFGPGFAIPGTVEIQAFTMSPGDVVPWHYHKGLSYVVVVRGTLTEQELIGDGQCTAPAVDVKGSAFVEPPGRRHTVANLGTTKAVIYWATIFPKDDPDGDAVFVDDPGCH